jgi:thiol-disulfide isomerase/thioredoxin
MLLRSFSVVLALGCMTDLAVGNSFELAPEARQAKSAEDDAVKIIETRFRNETDSYEKAFDDFEKSATLDKPFHYDLAGLEEFLESQMVAAPTAEARQTAAIHLLALTGYAVAIPSSVYKQVLQIVPADSATWSKRGESIEYEVEGLDPNRAKNFLEQMANLNASRDIQATAQLALVKLARRQRDSKWYEAAFAKLEQYKDLKDFKFQIFLLNPRNKIVPGSAAPVFHLPAIEGSGEITNQSLTGKWYLIDFWATWCGPCMGERAALLEAYGKFKNKGFTIVSISLDEAPEKVVSFRKNRWSMPWAQAFLPGGQNSQTAKDYEVDRIGLPRLVLVDPNGKVAASQQDLGRELLDRTLADFLGATSKRE